MYEEVDENEGYYDEEDLGCDEGASGEIVDFLGGEALQPFSFGLKSKQSDIFANEPNPQKILSQATNSDNQATGEKDLFQSNSREDKSHQMGFKSLANPSEGASKRTRYLKDHYYEDADDNQPTFAEPLAKRQAAKKIEFDADDLMSLLSKPMVSKQAQDKYSFADNKQTCQDGNFEIDAAPLNRLANKGTVVTAAGTTQYGGSEINMAETYDENHFDIEIDDDFDDEVTPIICEDDDDGPDFTKMNRRQRNVASEIEEQPKRGKQGSKRDIDPSSLQSLDKFQNLDLRRGFAIDKTKKKNSSHIEPSNSRFNNNRNQNNFNHSAGSSSQSTDFSNPLAESLTGEQLRMHMESSNAANASKPKQQKLGLPKELDFSDDEEFEMFFDDEEKMSRVTTFKLKEAVPAENKVWENTKKHDRWVICEAARGHTSQGEHERPKIINQGQSVRLASMMESILGNIQTLQQNSCKKKRQGSVSKHEKIELVTICSGVKFSGKKRVRPTLAQLELDNASTTALKDHNQRSVTGQPIEKPIQINTSPKSSKRSPPNRSPTSYILPKSRISPRALESPRLFKRMSPRKSVSPCGSDKPGKLYKHRQSPKLKKKSRSPKVMNKKDTAIDSASPCGQPDFIKKNKVVKMDQAAKMQVSMLSNVHSKVQSSGIRKIKLAKKQVLFTKPSSYHSNSSSSNTGRGNVQFESESSFSQLIQKQADSGRPKVLKLKTRSSIKPLPGPMLLEELSLQPQISAGEEPAQRQSVISPLKSDSKLNSSVEQFDPNSMKLKLQGQGLTHLKVKKISIKQIKLSSAKSPKKVNQLENSYYSAQQPLKRASLTSAVGKRKIKVLNISQERSGLTSQANPFENPVAQDVNRSQIVYSQPKYFRK